MDAGPDIGSGLARLGRLPAALGTVVAMGAGEEADLRALRIAPLAMLGLDHDGPEGALVGGRGEDFRETRLKLGTGEVFWRGASGLRRVAGPDRPSLAVRKKTAERNDPLSIRGRRVNRR
jgi:hypothetical protein